jgi:hypothetical protein
LSKYAVLVIVPRSLDKSPVSPRYVI